MVLAPLKSIQPNFLFHVNTSGFVHDQCGFEVMRIGTGSNLIADMMLHAVVILSRGLDILNSGDIGSGDIGLMPKQSVRTGEASSGC